MRKVFVEFELFAIHSSQPFICIKPDYIFSGEYDKDDDKSFSSLCDLEYKVQNLAHSFKELDYQVSVIRTEKLHLNIE